MKVTCERSPDASTLETDPDAFETAKETQNLVGISLYHNPYTQNRHSFVERGNMGSHQRLACGGVEKHRDLSHLLFSAMVDFSWTPVSDWFAFALGCCVVELVGPPPPDSLHAGPQFFGGTWPPSPA